MNNDLVFDRDNTRFNFRAVGILIHDNKVLLHKINNNPYWSLPGGRVAFGESSQNSVIREMEEELGVNCTILRPLWVMENFFHSFNRDTHELAFYFLLSVPDELLTKGISFTQKEYDSTLYFQWHPLDTIESATLNPSFLRKALKQLPENLTYIVHKDESFK
ncbi:MAG: NUDIX hydrolase [Fibrobacterota bacterium]|nr:NUDIX hydrolase [Chitinispirillaceae bacterium]